ncbi:MAG TPA: NAD(P)/FAD-dependent oxidoreductase [Firmicutes bacterium]|nr:NAD(P)/FAD-dependent oxidoreductase [Bacillota bacterium]
MEEKTGCVIIGAGASGLLAAGTLAEYGVDTLILEKNHRAAKKVLITGKGRCNVTNCCDISEFMGNVAAGGRFLYSALSRFSPYDTMGFFEDKGVPLKVERGQRVFPQSDKAEDIADALLQYALGANNKIWYDCPVRSLLLEDGMVRGVVLGDGQKIFSEKVIVCTGGKSYPGTGSTGDGYFFAKQAGHTVNPPVPSLIPLVIQEPFCKDAQGLSLRNISLKAVDEKTGKVIFEQLGEMLFTHFGVSGPLVLSASCHMRPMESGRYKLFIDLKPGLDDKQLDARLQRDFEKFHNRDFINSLSDLLPRKLIGVLVHESGIPGAQKVNQITRQQRQAFCRLLKAFPMTVEGTRPIQEAIITSGGVELKEVQPKTMESKLVRGLYFAGEVLDADAYTGGFNLQIAFSTARAAADAIGQLF